MKLILFILILLSSISIVRADNTTRLSFGCAPWDGQTLEVSVGAPDVSINITIWSKGLNDLEKGERTIVINNKGVSPGVIDATGRATLMGTMIANTSKTDATEKDLTVHFDELELKEGGRASGYVKDSDETMQWTFNGIIQGAQHCG